MRGRHLVTGAMLAGIAAPVLAAPQRVYVKPEPVTAAVMDADRDACVQAALAYVNGPASPAPRPRNPTTDEAIAGAFDLRGPRAAMAAEIRCMADRGYVLLPLTREEDKALARLRDPAARDRWYDALVATGLGARIAAARATS